ncbi:GL26735 [Drosophila persimilis]|uniref:GL26735 n=1 Tax=Drosophila persimilis TaxID=7234 RepID=B4H2T0_DROPE|nr:GL26735 [Drosophila persimilis]
MDAPNEIAYSRNLRDHRTSGRRLEVEKKIVIGSFARRLEEPIGEWSHHFQVYLRSMYENENPNAAGGQRNPQQPRVSDFVSKAVFRFLGPCPEYVEIVERGPFTVSSYCCGSLKVIVTLIFRVRYHTCGIVRHLITVPADGVPQIYSLNKRVQSIIFVNPSPRMKRMLRFTPKPIDLTKDNPDPEEQAEYLQRELRRARKSLLKHPRYLINPPKRNNDTTTP